MRILLMSLILVLTGCASWDKGVVTNVRPCTEVCYTQITVDDVQYWKFFETEYQLGDKVKVKCKPGKCKFK